MTTGNAAPTSIEQLSPKMELQGTVKKIDLYGALVDVGIGRLGLLHISQLSEAHVKNVTDVLREGDTVTVWVQEVDRKRGRINLTMLRPADVSWSDIDEGKVFMGKVVRLEKFGAFVDIGAERPGLVHVSELAKGYVGDPSEVVRVDDEIQVKVIGINRRKKQIDLSVRALEEVTAKVAVEEEEDSALPTAMELALRRAGLISGADTAGHGHSGKKRTKKNKRREEHEAIFARTLQQHAKE
jgi:predicted RNA-binding protein with RPS1 domain